MNLNGYYIRVNGSLIIQPGVTINLELVGTEDLGSIQVNGVLQARGTSDKPVRFKGGARHWDSIMVPDSLSSINFNAHSLGWNEEAGFGCIIENSEMNSTSVVIGSSVKFSGNQLTRVEASVAGGSPLILNNIVTGINNLNGGGIYVGSGSPKIYSNTLSNASINISGGSTVVDSNKVSGGRVSVGADAGTTKITNNIISSVNLSASSLSACISIFVSEYGRASDVNLVLVEKNLLENGYYGIQLESSRQTIINKPITIRYNTISDNNAAIGIRGGFSPTIAYNNIYDNNAYIQLSWPTANDVNATNNWWGTTDTTKIDAGIHDFYDDFDLGKVNYIPILTVEEPQAKPNTDTPLLTPTPSANPASPNPLPTPSASQIVSLSPSTSTNSESPMETPYVSSIPQQTPFQTAMPSQNPTVTHASADNEGNPSYGVNGLVAVLVAVIVVLIGVVVALLRKVLINAKSTH